MSWTSDWFINFFRGFHKNLYGRFHAVSCAFVRNVLMTRRLWCHVLIRSNLSCFGGFYFVFTLYRFKKKLMSPILCSISKIWTSGWRSHGNIKLGKPHLIFPCDPQPSLHIFDMKHNGWQHVIMLFPAVLCLWTNYFKLTDEERLFSSL